MEGKGSSEDVSKEPRPCRGLRASEASTAGGCGLVDCITGKEDCGCRVD